MTHPARRRLDQEGFSLIELIVTVAIMGICFVALIVGLGAAVRGSGRQRTHAALTSALLSAAEDLRSPAVAYVDCAPGYPVDVPAGFTATATVMGAWNRDPAVNRFDASACGAGIDTGLQLIELRVTSENAQLATEDLLVVKRRP